MKKADEAVEKVLAGLRGVEVEAGFEERMVRRVRVAAREHQARGWFGVWQWVGIGSVAILLIGIGVNLRFRERRELMASKVNSDGTGLKRSGGVQEGVSQRLKPRGPMSVYGTAEAVPLRRAATSRRAGSGVSVVLDAGFPAPPLPLTAQERLLLRAAQGGDAQPAVVLEVSVLPPHDAEETAEFVEFFEQDRQVEPSQPGENE